MSDIRNEHEYEPCEFCGKPSTCALREDNGDAPACDNCCTHGCDVGCFELPQADDARKHVTS